MSLFVNDVAFHILLRLADGDVLATVSHIVVGHVTDGLGRAIAVAHDIVRRRHHRRQLFTAREKPLQRLAFEVGGKLEGHLRGHEGVGDAVLLEIVIQGHQVKTDFLRDDIELGTDGERAIDLLYRGVEAVAGVCGDFALRGDVVTSLMHVAESHHVAVLHLAPFGHARGTGSVNHGHQTMGIRLNQLDGCRESRGDVTREQRLALIEVHQRKQLLVRNQQFGGRILHHKFETFLGIAGIQRLVGTTGFQHTDRGNGHPFATRNQDGDHVFRP